MAQRHEAVAPRVTIARAGQVDHVLQIRMIHGLIAARPASLLKQVRPRVGPVAMHSIGPTGRSTRAVSRG